MVSPRRHHFFFLELFEFLSRSEIPVKVVPSCAPCILQRILGTAQKITDDPWLHDKVLNQVMAEWIESEGGVTPAERVSRLHDLVCRNLGVTDPWQKVRDGWVEEVQSLLDPVREKVAAAPDPLLAALAISARANVFDDDLLTKKKIREDLRKMGLHPSRAPASPDELSVSDVDRFREELRTAKNLLFIHDSAPELPFDRVLFEQIVRERPEIEMTSVVRPQPVLLDATRADLVTFGFDTLPAVKAVVDPGSTGLGITLEAAQREFRELFDGSDLVIAKGQAHVETLARAERGVYFLFRIKCAVMAREEGGRVGEIVFARK